MSATTTPRKGLFAFGRELPPRSSLLPATVLVAVPGPRSGEPSFPRWKKSPSVSARANSQSRASNPVAAMEDFLNSGKTVARSTAATQVSTSALTVFKPVTLTVTEDGIRADTSTPASPTLRPTPAKATPKPATIPTPAAAPAKPSASPRPAEPARAPVPPVPSPGTGPVVRTRIVRFPQVLAALVSGPQTLRSLEAQFGEEEGRLVEILAGLMASQLVRREPGSTSADCRFHLTLKGLETAGEFAPRAAPVSTGAALPRSLVAPSRGISALTRPHGLPSETFQAWSADLKGERPTVQTIGGDAAEREAAELRRIEAAHSFPRAAGAKARHSTSPP
jgi:hypothetical protein